MGMAPDEYITYTPCQGTFKYYGTCMYYVEVLDRSLLHFLRHVCVNVKVTTTYTLLPAGQGETRGF